MPKPQPRPVCHLCGHDDEVAGLPVGGSGEWSYTCTSTTGHGAPYSWTVAVGAAGLSAREGITAELGLYEDLPRCLRPGDPWVEHGVVEHRYQRFRPDVYFDELLPRYGHVARGPKRYTVSAFMASALGQLSREGTLAWQYAEATGFWAYNGRISYWALPPGPPLEARLTWEHFAVAEGLDPQHWDLTRPR